MKSYTWRRRELVWPGKSPRRRVRDQSFEWWLQLGLLLSNSCMSFQTFLWYWTQWVEKIWVKYRTMKTKLNLDVLQFHSNFQGTAFLFFPFLFFWRIFNNLISSILLCIIFFLLLSVMNAKLELKTLTLFFYYLMAGFVYNDWLVDQCFIYCCWI